MCRFHALAPSRQLRTQRLRVPWKSFPAFPLGAGLDMSQEPVSKSTCKDGPLTLFGVSQTFSLSVLGADSKRENSQRGFCADWPGRALMALWTLRNLLLVDAAVCVLYILQLALAPGSFEESSGIATTDDFRLLFIGIYTSWCMMLVYLASAQQMHSRGLAFTLTVSAVAQLPIGWAINCSPLFFYTNQSMMTFWVVAFASFAFRRK